MSYDCDCRTVAFGAVEDVCEFASSVMDLGEKFGFGGAVTRAQWNGIHYVTVSHKAPEEQECQFWDRIIPQFPKLRFLLSRVSERDDYLNEVIRHRHDPFGFYRCLSDHTTSQTMGNFPSDRNPISVLDDFRDEVLKDDGLSHALNLLGYPKEMLVGCSVSTLA